MSAINFPIAPKGGHVVVLCRKVESGGKVHILPKQVDSVDPGSGVGETFYFDERGRIYRMVRTDVAAGKELLNRAFAQGTSLHELGLLQLNSEVQRVIAKNRREHRGE